VDAVQLKNAPQKYKRKMKEKPNRSGIYLPQSGPVRDHEVQPILKIEV